MRQIQLLSSSQILIDMRSIWLCIFDCHLHPLLFCHFPCYQVMSMTWLAIFAYLVVASCDGIHKDWPRVLGLFRAMGFGIFFGQLGRGLNVKKCDLFHDFQYFFNSSRIPLASLFNLKTKPFVTGFWHFHLSLGLHCRSCRDIISQCLQWDVCSQALRTWMNLRQQKYRAWSTTWAC